MVAPRTRAERPAETAPAPRPPRKPTRSAAPNGNRERLAGPTATLVSPIPAADPNGKASRNGTGPSTGAHRKLPSPQQMGRELIAQILARDEDADIEPIQRAIDFAIEAHGDQP
ncbi:MAG TPA: hypothetical protein VHR16_08865, partial [Candidatus Limnocylindrales bacterium]|nr:hypothetical protein [Candidatus Limnocylindrales bacterium]